MSLEPNPNVPTGVMTPDWYLYISTAPITIDTPQPKDVFILAPMINSSAATTNAPYSLSPGTATLNEIQQCTDISRVNALFGRRSVAANRFRSAIQQVPIGINIFVAAIAEPTNSGFSGVATKLVRFSGTAVGSGEIKLKVCGALCPISVANGDTASTIAAAALSALGGAGGGANSKIPDAPMIPAAVIDIQLPVITITSDADGSGSTFTIVANGVTKTVAITAAWTPTQSATAIAAALSGDTAFPLTATSNLGVVSCTWRSTFPVSTLTISTDDTQQTYALTYLGTGASTGATVPLTYVSRGEVGNDSPVSIEIPPEITGIQVSPGSLTVTGTGSGGSTFTLKVSSQECPVSIPNTTSATAAATLIAAGINAATFPLSATAAGATVNLFWRSGWLIDRIQVKSTEPGGGQTYLLADRHDSAGAITSVTTVAGTSTFTALQGSGTPTLTTLLANRAKFRPMIEWFSEYTDLTSINALTEHIEQYANGYYQQNQRVTFCDTRGVEDVKTLVTGASPALTNYWRYAIITEQDPFTQGGATACQTAALLASLDLPYNVDGTNLQQGTIEPLMPPRPDTELGPTSVDVAMSSYHLTVVKGNNGFVQIVRGVTTWGDTQSRPEWRDWSYGRMFDAVRYGLRRFLNTRFNGKVLFTGGGQIRVSNAFTLKDVEAAVLEYLTALDGVIIDNAASLAQYIRAEVDTNDAGFIRITLRIRVPREFHVGTGVISGIR